MSEGFRLGARMPISRASVDRDFIESRGDLMAISIDDAIEEIVRKVPSNRIFDSHFVIRRLNKQHHDQYLSFAAEAAPDSRRPTLPMHGKIGQKINKLSGQLIKRLEYTAWSENERGNPGPCACWIRSAARSPKT
jgi:hypothetical protein